jgi:hypothetical protein
MLALAGALIGMIGWWFSQNYGFYVERVHVGFSGEARINPWYAAQLLLERLGKPVRQQNALPSVMPAAVDEATLILAAQRDSLSPPQVSRLLQWVEQGGRLIVGVEQVLDHDLLLDGLEVSAQWPVTDKPHSAHADPPIETVVLPGGRTLRVQFGRSPRMTDHRGAASWSHGAEGASSILQIPRGSGAVILVSTLRPFGNRDIGRLDHAELLWHLARHGKGPVILVRRIESPSLPAWLWQHAPAALAALGVFLLLWLWRVVPRFGPLQPAVTPDRRSLLEQLRAVGRFYADEKELGRLLHSAREDCSELFHRAAPLVRGLDAAAQLKEAARLTGLRPRDLMHAFTGPVSGRQEFSTAVRTLAKFRRSLSRRLSGDQAT